MQRRCDARKVATTEVARQLYGADGLAEAFSEEMTSTSLEAVAPRKKKKRDLPLPANATFAEARLPN